MSLVSGLVSSGSVSDIVGAGDIVSDPVASVTDVVNVVVDSAVPVKEIVNSAVEDTGDAILDATDKVLDTSSDVVEHAVDHVKTAIVELLGGNSGSNEQPPSSTNTPPTLPLPLPPLPTATDPSTTVNVPESTPDHSIPPSSLPASSQEPSSPPQTSPPQASHRPPPPASPPPATSSSPQIPPRPTSQSSADPGHTPTAPTSSTGSPSSNEQNTASGDTTTDWHPSTTGGVVPRPVFLPHVGSSVDDDAPNGNGADDDTNSSNSAEFGLSNGSSTPNGNSNNGSSGEWPGPGPHMVPGNDGHPTGRRVNAGLIVGVTLLALLLLGLLILFVRRRRHIARRRAKRNAWAQRPFSIVNVSRRRRMLIDDSDVESMHGVPEMAYAPVAPVSPITPFGPGLPAAALSRSPSDVSTTVELKSHWSESASAISVPSDQDNQITPQRWNSEWSQGTKSPWSFHGSLYAESDMADVSNFSHSRSNSYSESSFSDPPSRPRSVASDMTCTFGNDIDHEASTATVLTGTRKPAPIFVPSRVVSLSSLSPQASPTTWPAPSSWGAPPPNLQLVSPFLLIPTRPSPSYPSFGRNNGSPDTPTDLRSTSTLFLDADPFASPMDPPTTLKV